jgi:Trk K+ transport system NAD-binding subunit
MKISISRRKVRKIFKLAYLVYPAGITAIILAYTLLFMMLRDHFVVPHDMGFFTALYWVVISMTTTGYGDIYPVTIVGKLFSMLVVVTGLMILFAVVLPLMVTPIMDHLIKSPRSRVPDWFRDHVIICGYNAIVDSLIDELADRDIPFVVIDQSPENVRVLQRHGHDVIQRDPSDEDALRNARIESASYVIANSGDDHNAAIALTASQISGCRIIALAESMDMAKYLEFAGADIVVSPKQVLGANIGLMALSSIESDICSAIDLGGNLKMCKLPVYPDSPMAGKSLEEIGMTGTTGASVVAIFKNGELVADAPPGTIVDESTVLAVVGTADQLRNATGFSRHKAPVCDGHCIIAGYGDVGREAGRRLDEKRVMYTVIDRRHYDVRDQIVADSTDRDALARAGIEYASTILVTLNDDAKNMLTILLARNLNPHVSIIARANLDSSVGKMYRAGADYVMSLSAIGGQILVRIVERGALEDAVFLSGNVLLSKFRVKGSKLAGKSIKETGMRTRTGCTIVGIQESGAFKPNPAPSEVLSPDAVIVTVGTSQQLEACAKAFELQRLAD